MFATMATRPPSADKNSISMLTSWFVKHFLHHMTRRLSSSVPRHGQHRTRLLRGTAGGAVLQTNTHLSLFSGFKETTQFDVLLLSTKKKT